MYFSRDSRTITLRLKWVRHAAHTGRTENALVKKLEMEETCT
jgi:hypothetical protein